MKLKIAGAPKEQIEALKKQAVEQAKLRSDLQKVPKDEKKFLADQKTKSEKMVKTMQKNLPGMLEEAKKTLKANADNLVIQRDNSVKLASLNNEASKTAELQKLMLLSTEGGQKKVASMLKGKTGEEVFKTTAALGLGEGDIQGIYQDLQEKATTDKELFALGAEQERVMKAFQAYMPLEEKGTQRAKKLKKDVESEDSGVDDFYDILRGGFVNVKAGDILIDKTSFAKGMGGPPGAAMPAVAAAARAARAAGAGTTVNINVVATEKDLAGKIANQIKKELYNRQISTSSYSLA